MEIAHHLTNLKLLPTGLHYTHPIIISDVDLSSFLNKPFHCVCMFLFSCDMQGSLLIERRKQVTITISDFCVTDQYSEVYNSWQFWWRKFKVALQHTSYKCITRGWQAFFQTKWTNDTAFVREWGHLTFKWAVQHTLITTLTNPTSLASIRSKNSEFIHIS